MPLLDEVRRTLRRYHLAIPTTRVAVAVSGGSDSVALLHLLLELQQEKEAAVAGVVHFNHQLRDEADVDERFCAALAGKHGLPFVVERQDVAALARAGRQSLEAGAHDARYAFFERAMRSLTADVVAVGHTKDDQAETFLLRTLRGAGARGLAGMYPRHGRVIRPLIDCERGELGSYLRDRGISFRADTSNEDVAIPRNRVRAELVPLLRQRFNPSVVDALAKEAEILREQDAYLSARAKEWLQQAADTHAARVSFDCQLLVDTPPAIARLGLHAAMSALAHERPVSFADVQRVLDVAAGDAGGFDGPGQRVERIGARVVLTGRLLGSRGRPAAGPAQSANIFRDSLSIPGEIPWGTSGATISAEMVPSWGGPIDGTTAAAVQMDEQPTRLTVRSRRPGDRFQPLGLIGRKKLHDFLIDRKVARNLRDDVPLVVDSADRIIWVAGHAIDEAFRVKDPSQSVIILRLKGVGGSV